MIPTPLNSTLRQLLTHRPRSAVLDRLDDFHPGDQVSQRPAYDEVITVLLAKPLTPPIHPILITFYPKEDDDTPAFISVHLHNQHYQPPAPGLEPWHGAHGRGIPAGYYDGDADIHHETFSASFVPWDRLVDASILLENPQEIHFLAPTPEHIAAHILWELTFMGFDEEQIKGRGEIIIGMKDAYLADKSKPDVD